MKKNEKSKKERETKTASRGSRPYSLHLLKNDQVIRTTISFAKHFGGVSNKNSTRWNIQMEEIKEIDKGGITNQNGKQKGKRERTKEVCTQEY